MCIFQCNKLTFGLAFPRLVANHIFLVHNFMTSRAHTAKPAHLQFVQRWHKWVCLVQVRLCTTKWEFDWMQRGSWWSSHLQLISAPNSRFTEICILQFFLAFQSVVELRIDKSIHVNWAKLFEGIVKTWIEGPQACFVCRHFFRQSRANWIGVPFVDSSSLYTQYIN